MFVDVIPQHGLEVVDLLSSSHLVDQFYLAHGTGLSLQFGHRESHDLDFFTRSEFSPSAVIDTLGDMGHFELTGEAPGSVHGMLNNVRLTFL
ncbi:MAG: nucleotidyl transferase AbiEii/AbiGii toxin family protein [Firmicutes bacterium]|nr:nucleotidyl transferase AbiEii/AbiGii toxin family protein [Bacillota bacterium]